MEILAVIIFLVQAYLNVSALVDIEHRVYVMTPSETVLRFGWSLFLLVFTAGTFVLLMILRQQT